MKLLKKSLLAMLIILAALVVMPQMQNKVEAAVKISATKKTMYKGYTYKLKITGTKKKVTWSSSNKSKATVNSKGKVYVKKNGKVTITAKVGGKKYKCKVTIKNKPYTYTQFKTTFYDLKDVAKEYREVDKIKNYKDFVFDLDGDGKKDTIRLKNYGKDEDGDIAYKLIYNGNEFYDIETSWGNTVYIVDLNKNDKTLELIVRTVGPGDCYNFEIFSKVGSKIKKIKRINSAYLEDIELKVDQKGKIIIDDPYLQYVSPKVFRDYYKLVNGKVKTKKLDANKIKNIKFSTKSDMLFTKNMKVVEHFSEYQREEDDGFKDAYKRAGIIEGKFKSFSILEFKETGEFKVKLKNGTKGYLFTVAGFLAG